MGVLEDEGAKKANYCIEGAWLGPWKQLFEVPQVLFKGAMGPNAGRTGTIPGDLSTWSRSWLSGDGVDDDPGLVGYEA
jgi:hypothetical protein